MLRLRKHVLFAWIVIACSMVVVAAQQRGAGGAPYTAAQAAAKTWKHEPATQDGTPVTRWAEMNLTFHLDKGQSTGGTKQP